ncbi:allantoate permease [Fusarium bulbicola]|nr:allantoate permease [Fusarium bulbicola]
MKVTSFLTALVGVHSVAAYEYVYLVNSVKGNEVSSGMAYYGDKNPPGNMARPSDYTDVTHGSFTYWEGKAVKDFFFVEELQYVLLLRRSMGYTERVDTFFRPEALHYHCFVISFGHLVIIWGSYLWPSTNAPQHLVRFATLTATCGLGCVIALTAPGYLKLQLKEPTTEAKQEPEALQQQDQQRQQSWGPQ